MIDVTGLLDYVERQKEEDFFKLVREAITLALRPWLPGKVFVYLSDFISAPNTIVVEVDLLPKWPFAFEIDPFDRLTHDPMCLAYKVADEAYFWFLKRPTLPVDDHIVLGEE